MVKLTTFMYPSKAARNSFALFLIKPRFTTSFLNILKISSADFVGASSDLIFGVTKFAAQVLCVTMFSML